MRTGALAPSDSPPGHDARCQSARASLDPCDRIAQAEPMNPTTEPAAVPTESRAAMAVIPVAAAPGVVAPPRAGVLGRLFRRMLAHVAHASAWLRVRLTIVLLVLVYITVFPLVAAFRRLRSLPATGWRHLDDPGVASLDRLRRPF